MDDRLQKHKTVPERLVRCFDDEFLLFLSQSHYYSSKELFTYLFVDGYLSVLELLANETDRRYRSDPNRDGLMGGIFSQNLDHLEPFPPRHFNEGDGGYDVGSAPHDDYIFADQCIKDLIFDFHFEVFGEEIPEVDFLVGWFCHDGPGEDGGGGLADEFVIGVEGEEIGAGFEEERGVGLSFVDKGGFIVGPEGVILVLEGVGDEVDELGVH